MEKEEGNKPLPGNCNNKQQGALKYFNTYIKKKKLTILAETAVQSLKEESTLQ